MAEIPTIKEDFSFLSDREDVFAVLLYGSVAKGEETPRSDIDICIVAPRCPDRRGLFRDISRRLDTTLKRYDIRIFEELPLYIQIQIVQKNEIINTKDIYELYEYFYNVLKLWEIQAARQTLTGEELAQMLE
ncbi:MAG: nucleotidyltransferase domain-containing protein [Candidatus Methanoperedens sp.]|nr:nucleotidyltransferase domain-containing protein [Candidatus Methanoperedens sp.]